MIWQQIAIYIILLVAFAINFTNAVHYNKQYRFGGNNHIIPDLANEHKINRNQSLIVVALMVVAAILEYWATNIL